MANNSHSGTPTYTTDSIIGDYNVLTEGSSIQQLKKYLEPYSKDELVSLVMSVASNEEIVCQHMLTKIQTDKKWCKLFVHGLAFSTSKEQLEKHYKHYGKVKEAVVLVDKKGNSKGYGFVTFANAKSALEAAKDPKKRIDNRVTHCNLAFKGNPKKFAMQNGANGNALSPKQRENANDRRLFVHSLAWKTTDDSLADVFREYGELQEAVVIRDKKTNKSKGYGFVTFKYSESAQAALADPNKKIDGRQTHCNYACERSNINGGGETINSPNSTIGSTPNNVNSHSNNRNNDQSQRSHQSLTSLTSPQMNLNNSNISMQSSNSGHPQMSTFASNPLQLHQNLSLGGSNRINSNSMNTNLHNNIHNTSQLGTGIDISSLQSIPSYQNTINLSMPGATSQQQQRRPMGIPNYAPTGSAYGTNTNQSPYGHPPPQSHQHTNHNSVHNQRPHDSISHLISPNGNHQDPVSLLRNLGAGPNSPIPSSVLSINGLTGTQQMGLSSMIMRNPQTQGGGNNSGFPGSHPSNLNLGHSQNPSTTQNQSQSQTGIVVSGINNINNTFTSQQSMPRHQPPATPPYAHVQTTNKENLPTNSPYYGSNTQSLGIPGFKPQQVGTLGAIGTMPQSSKKIIATNTNQQQQQQPMMNMTALQQKTQQLQQQIGVLNMANSNSNNLRNNNVNNNPNNNMRNNNVNSVNLNINNVNNGNNNNMAQQNNSIKAKIPPLNVKAVQNVQQQQDEGNLSPQSQVDSDDEGDKV